MTAVSGKNALVIFTAIDVLGIDCAWVAWKAQPFPNVWFAYYVYSEIHLGIATEQCITKQSTEVEKKSIYIFYVHQNNLG